MPHRTVWFSCLLSALMSLSARAQPPDQPKPTAPKETTVAATGTARVERTPDYVDVMLGTVAIDKTAGAAHAAVSKSMEAAVAAIKALKLQGEDLQTGSVDLSPRYERRDRSSEDDLPRIIGYSASVTLRIRTTDLKAVPKVIDAALAAGCNRVDYVQFGIKEALAAREEAVKLATQAARRKAGVMADALELRLTRVVEAGTTSHQGGGWYGANRVSQVAQTVSEPAPSEDADSGVVPGKIEVWADATITFAAAGRQ
jgi:uncharacterized protein